jgi:EAL domain-containing protein (putative c-di-GMP-specific phosphodiesterase class I)
VGHGIEHGLTESVAFLHIWDNIPKYCRCKRVFVTFSISQCPETHTMRSHPQALLDAIPDLLFEVGFDGRIHDLHAPQTDLLPKPPASLLGKLIGDVLPAKSAAICLSAIEEASRLGRSSGAIYSLDLPIGRRWFEISVAPIPPSPDAEWEQRFVFLSRDVSFRRLFQCAQHAGGADTNRVTSLMPTGSWQGDIGSQENNGVRFLDAPMQSDLQQRVAHQDDLRRALARQEFHLLYQPQVTQRGALMGAEALLRWTHPTRGLVPPSEFIPLAEQTGLIVPLGAWVLESACRQLAVWADHTALCDVKIAVNVSALQFQQDDFLAQTLSILASTNARPDRLKMELTESLMLKNVDSAIDKMRQLREAGVTFSLDDFGTGFSSLTYLKRLPLDQLKIDQSFVRNILSDANDAAIAKMVIALGQSMGLEVIAEGVELHAQHATLAALGCQAFQGYLFGRPMPVASFEALAIADAGALLSHPL